MRHPLLLAATALAALAATAACSATPTVGLTGPAVDPGSTTATTTTSPTTTAPVPTETTGEVTPKPTAKTPAQDTGPPPCQGAVTYTINGGQAGPVRPPRCIAVGGLLRVIWHGPEGFSFSPLNLVSCDYEGGVHECRLIRTGSTTFTITRDGQPQTFTIVSSAAASPPLPAPACLGAVIFTAELSLSLPPWPAICMKRGGTVRVKSFGPGGFGVDPPANASCFYEAAVRECRLVKTGTVVFTAVTATETRTLTVVVIA